MNEVATEKTMTVKEVASAMGVSTDTVKNCIRRIMPNKMQNGKQTFLTEMEVSFISKELKNNLKVTEQLTYEAALQVKNATTDLEILSNAVSAFAALKDLYNRKEVEYQATIQQQKQQLIEQKPKVDVYNRIADGKGCFTFNQAAKALKLPYGNKTLFKKLKEQGILNQDNSPNQEQTNNGNFKVVVKFINENIGNKPVTLITSKGLVYLSKKLNTTIDETVKADA